MKHRNSGITTPYIRQVTSVTYLTSQSYFTANCSSLCICIFLVSYISSNNVLLISGIETALTDCQDVKHVRLDSIWRGVLQKI